MRIQPVEGWGYLVEIVDKGDDKKVKVMAETLGEALKELTL